MHHIEIKNKRRSIRIPEYNYGQEGYYFVTICTDKRRPLLGEIKNDQMVLNYMGNIVLKEWKKTPAIRRNVGLGQFVIMPNHLHGVVMIHDEICSQKSGYISSGRMPSGRMPYAPTFMSPSHSLGAVIRGFKSSVTKEIRNLDSGMKNFWQRNYYEHVVRDERDLRRIEEYIENNPLEWALDEYYQSD